MRCVGHRVAPSRSATVCRLSAAARAGPCALGGSCAPGSALAAPGATARWKRLGRSTTKKRMAVVLGRQDGARRRRDMPGGAVTARGQRPRARGHGLCGRRRCNEAARRKSHPHHHDQNGQSCPNGRTGTTGVGRDGAGACTRQPTARERASGSLAGSSRHGFLGFTATTGTFHAGAPEMKVHDYCAATLVGQRVFWASPAMKPRSAGSRSPATSPSPPL